jgi:hypothetical protein
VAIDGTDAQAYAKAAGWRRPDDGLALMRIALQRTADHLVIPRPECPPSGSGANGSDGGSSWSSAPQR